jgi:hypothetical protein
MGESRDNPQPDGVGSDVGQSLRWSQNCLEGMRTRAMVKDRKG